MYIMKQIGTHHGNKVIVRKLNTGYLLVNLGDARLKGTDQRTSIVPQSKDLSVDDIDMKQALEVLEYPKNIGSFGGNHVYIHTSKHGYLFRCGNVKVDIPNSIPQEEWLNWASEVYHDPKRRKIVKRKHVHMIKTKMDRSTHGRIKSFAYQKLLENIMKNPTLLKDMSRATFLNESELMDILNKKKN